MDHSNHIESTLNALLLNAAELKKKPSTDLSDEQSRLLDTLFSLWNKLTDDEKNSLLSTQLESKVQHLAKKNADSLHPVQPRIRTSRKTHCASSKQLDLTL